MKTKILQSLFTLYAGMAILFAVLFAVVYSVATFSVRASVAVFTAIAQTWHSTALRFNLGNPQQYPTLEQFAANIAAVLGKIEVVEQELYDRVVYPLAGIAAISFFTQPAGGGFSSESGLAAAGAKTLADTNMTQNGQLPAPQAFWIDNIQVDVDPGSITTANLFATKIPTVVDAAAAITQVQGVQDKNAILNAGILQLVIGQKPYYTMSPLSYFPPRAQKRVDVAIGNADTTTHNSVATSLLWVTGAMRTLDPGLGLATGFNFAVNVTFPVLIATVTNNARIKATLGGWLFRAAQ